MASQSTSVPFQTECARHGQPTSGEDILRPEQGSEPGRALTAPSNLDNLGPPASAQRFRIAISFDSGSMFNRLRAWTICRSAFETSRVTSRVAGAGGSMTVTLQIETRPDSQEPAYVPTQ